MNIFEFNIDLKEILETIAFNLMNQNHSFNFGRDSRDLDIVLVRVVVDYWLVRNLTISTSFYFQQDGNASTLICPKMGGPNPMIAREKNQTFYQDGISTTRKFRNKKWHTMFQRESSEHMSRPDSI